MQVFTGSPFNVCVLKYFALYFKETVVMESLVSKILFCIHRASVFKHTKKMVAEYSFIGTAGSIAMCLVTECVIICHKQLTRVVEHKFIHLKQSCSTQFVPF